MKIERYKILSLNGIVDVSEACVCCVFVVAFEFCTVCICVVFVDGITSTSKDY